MVLYCCVLCYRTATEDSGTKPKHPTALSLIKDHGECLVADGGCRVDLLEIGHDAIHFRTLLRKFCPFSVKAN